MSPASTTTVGSVISGNRANWKLEMDSWGDGMVLTKNGGAEVSEIQETMHGEGAAAASSPAETDWFLEPHVHLRAADESRFPMCANVSRIPHYLQYEASYFMCQRLVSRRRLL